MNRRTLPLLATLTLACTLAADAPSSPPPDEAATAIADGKLPPDYRDWRVISLAHEAGDLNSLGVVLGNDIAIKAYRDGKLPFPDGAIIAALHYHHTPSAENNKIFGREQSFVPGAPTNIQFMVKDSSKYADTAGWKFAHFVDGKPAASAATLHTCYTCHQQCDEHDLVFTRYAP